MGNLVHRFIVEAGEGASRLEALESMAQELGPSYTIVSELINIAGSSLTIALETMKAVEEEGVVLNNGTTHPKTP